MALDDDYNDTGRDDDGGGDSVAENMGGDDAQSLTDALSDGGDETFVVGEQRKPVNKTSLLVFGAMVLGLGGYYMMYVRSGPASAEGATAEAAAADQTINQFLSSGEENLKVMRQLRQTTDKVVAQFKDSRVPQVPIDDLQANPFKYAQQKPGDPSADEAAAKKKRDEERAAAIAAVQNLQLQSVLHGSVNRTCMLNNKMYKEGQSVEGFVIEKINPHGVIVKQGSFRFELKMQQ